MSNKVKYKHLLSTICILIAITASLWSQNDSLNLINKKTGNDISTFQFEESVKNADSLINKEIDKQTQKAMESFNRGDTLAYLNQLEKLWKLQSKAYKYQLADETLKRMLIISKKYKSEYHFTNILFNIANNYYSMSNYNMSLEYYEEALNSYTSSNDKLGIAKTTKALANVVAIWGDYEKAIGFMQRARDIYYDIEDESGIANVNIGLGVIMQNWNRLDRALDYYNQALNYYRFNHDAFNEINALMHIGDVYKLKNNYRKTIEFNKQAIEIEKEVNNKLLHSIALSNLGEAWFGLHQYDTALYYHREAYKIKLEVGDQKRLAISYLNIGQTFHAKEKNDSAEYYLFKSYWLSRKIGLNTELLQTLNTLSEHYQKTNNFFLAYKYLKEHQILNNETFGKETNKLVQELAMKYESNKKETDYQLLKNKNDIQTLQLEKEKNSRYFTIIFAVFIVFIAFILIFFINLRSRTNKKNLQVLTFKNREIIKQKEELAELNTELRLSREKFRGIIENATIGIYQTNPEGEILFANKNLIKTLGYNTLEELQKIDLNENYQNRQQFLELIDKNNVISGKEEVWTRADGSKMYVIESAWLVRDKNGKIQYIEGLVENVTKRKKAEEALINSQIELRKTNNALVEKNKKVQEAIKEAQLAYEAKSAFLANVSHEIRTPMNSIIGFTELLLKLEENVRKRSYLAAIDSGSKSLLTLINDILDLSKMQAGKLELVYETISIRKIINEVEQIFSLQAENKNLDLKVITDEELPSSVKLDGVRLRQLIFNLMGNAIKFTSEGNVSMHISTETNEKTNQCKIIISVKDTGPGISVDDQKNIFNAFTQGKLDNKELSKGTGLGLTISKQLVELMNGQLTLESKIGKGTEFKIVIPNIEIVEKAKNTSSNTTVKKPELFLKKDKKTFFKQSADIDTETINKFNTEFAGKLKQISEGKFTDDIKEFASELSSFAEQIESGFFKSIAKSLIEAVNNFDIERIENQLLLLNNFIK